jgi:type IV secretion system protein VirB4
MQLLPSLSQGAKTVKREQAAGSHLPYARHVDDHTLETRDGLLLQTIRLRGLLFETADTGELNYRKTLRDAMLRAIGASRFALYHHVVRRRAEIDLDANYPDAFSQSLGDRWADRLGAKQLFVNDLYLTLMRRPLQGRIGLADQVRNWVTRAGQTRRHDFPHRPGGPRPATNMAKLQATIQWHTARQTAAQPC